MAEFPAKVWARVASRRLRRFSEWLETEDDGRGYGPLREAIAEYLGTSRGVRCYPDQIAIVSGVQQALDLLARLLVQPGDPVWMEDPGYFGATIAFRNAGATIVPVPVDEHGLNVEAGRKMSPQARLVYLTPAHQFPMGVVMSLERRLEAIDWAREAGAFVIEDDYDSEYRFEGRPVPALQGLDNGSNVIFVGTFNKLLFPSLRLGYVVLPPKLLEPFLVLRYGADLRFGSIDQAVLCDFIVEGHLGRHIGRMRELYAERLAALLEGGRRHLEGLMDISSIRAGLYTAAFLRNGMTSREAELAATEHEIESMGLHRFTLRRSDPRALLLGFGGFDPARIRNALARLARALEARGPHSARI
jgi:GntR family transcriptional regulator / MocR family aminotransferase